MAGASNEQLETRLAALQAEVARKNALLQKTRSCEDVILSEIASLLDFANSAASAASATPLSLSENDVYASLRELFVSASHVLERAALKLCVGFESTSQDRESRLQLMRGLLAPLEICVTSLSSAHGSVSVLQLACRVKAKELCQSCKAFVQALFNTNSSNSQSAASPAALCGSIEALCQEVRLLPVSNLAAVKRQIFEACKTSVQDSAREFQELHENGGDGGDEDDFFGDEDDDDDEEEDGEEDEKEPVAEADLERLLAASECLLALKSVLMSVCKDALTADTPVQVLQQVSAQCKLVERTCTDFSVEMYPKQDMARVAAQATALLFAVEAFVGLVVSINDNRALFETFKLKLALVVA